MWVVMSAAEREGFLAGVHVGVLSAAVGTAGRTLGVPVWYSYQPGGLLTVLTGRRSRKATVIRAAGRQRGGTRPGRAARHGPPLPRHHRRRPIRRRQPRPHPGERGVPDAPRALAQPGSGQGRSRKVAPPGIIRSAAAPVATAGTGPPKCRP